MTDEIPFRGKARINAKGEIEDVTMDIPRLDARVTTKMDPSGKITGVDVESRRPGAKPIHVRPSRRRKLLGGRK